MTQSLQRRLSCIWISLAEHFSSFNRVLYTSQLFSSNSSASMERHSVLREDMEDAQQKRSSLKRPQMNSSSSPSYNTYSYDSNDALNNVPPSAGGPRRDWKRELFDSGRAWLRDWASFACRPPLYPVYLGYLAFYAGAHSLKLANIPSTHRYSYNLKLFVNQIFHCYYLWLLLYLVVDDKFNHHKWIYYNRIYGYRENIYSTSILILLHPPKIMIGVVRTIHP